MRFIVWSPPISGNRIAVAEDLTRGEADMIAKKKNAAARKLGVTDGYTVTAEGEVPS